MSNSAQELRKLDEGLWTLDTTFTRLGCKGSLRMTVLETAAGLVLHSPVALDKDVRNALRSLGEIAVLFAPNLFHHMYLHAAQNHFPNARVLVPKGLERKIGKIANSEIVTDKTVVADGEIEHATLSGHDLYETVLFHRRSGTLVTADLLYNYQPEHNFTEKLFFRAIGCYGAPGVAFYHRYAIRDKSGIVPFQEAVGSWPVKRIVMCHGRIVEAPEAAGIFASAWQRFA